MIFFSLEVSIDYPAPMQDINKRVCNVLTEYLVALVLLSSWCTR
jgi:hypothetical protein